MAKFTVDVPCGPIWNNEDAQKKCPIVCAARMGKWNGQWKTVVPNEMSVCGCEYDTEKSDSSVFEIDVVAGPIWSNEDAQVKCPIICASYGGEWTGSWHTPKESWGKMSLCKCRFRLPVTQREFVFEVKGKETGNKLIEIKATSGETWGDLLKRYPAFIEQGLNGIVYKSRGGQGYLQKNSSGTYVKSTDVVEDGVEYVVTNL